MTTLNQISTRVAALLRDGASAAQNINELFTQLTPAEATYTTEIGWSVAATLAHLADSYAPSLLQTVIQRSRAGKSLMIPAWIIHTTNWIASLQNQRKPLARSHTQFESELLRALELLRSLSDSDLDRQISAPLIGTTSLEAYLHYVLIGHLEEHGAQIQHALQHKLTN